MHILSKHYCRCFHDQRNCYFRSYSSKFLYPDSPLLTQLFYPIYLKIHDTLTFTKLLPFFQFLQGKDMHIITILSNDFLLFDDYTDHARQMKANIVLTTWITSAQAVPFQKKNHLVAFYLHRDYTGRSTRYR